jgi:hypothetical protein
MLGLIAAAGVAAAQDRIEISRGVDSVVYGSCVPSLRAFNHTQTVVDYLEIVLSFTLKSGESRTLEFRSRYREGAERPLAPGATADLKVQLDQARPLGADCPDIVSVTVTDAICEAAGKPCTGVIAVNPGK